MANNCVIEFDKNEYGTYFTGQQLTGKVIISLSKTKNFRGIKLQVNGYAQCQWREHRGGKKPVHKKKSKRKHSFLGREDYIASTTFLEGSEMGPIIPLQPGTHTYNFACPIPINCPSSFEGTFGHIRYLVKVTMIRAGSSNRTYTKGFTVLKLLDLNRESVLLKSPASNESFENFCFLNGQAVHLQVDLTQTGYVPGQMILISCQVNNQSKATVKNLLITLNLRATYISDTPGMRTVYEKLCLVKQYCGPVVQQSIKKFAEVIRVPATAPTCDHLSKVVRISYEICVKALMGHFMSNPRTVIPITIGNVPLVSDVGQAEPPQLDLRPTTSASATQASAPDDQSISDGETQENFNLAPPSYEEAMFMTTNIAADDDTDVSAVSEAVQFTPRYPVYDVDNIVMSNVMNQTPPPNPPQKRRRRRNATPMQPALSSITEKTGLGCPEKI